jgi:hypothetical protein
MPSTDQVTAVLVVFATDAVNCWVWEIASHAEPGVTETETGAPTAREAVPPGDPIDAPMVVEPVPRPVARPELLIVATAGFDELQVTDVVKSWLEPSL